MKRHAVLLVAIAITGLTPAQGQEVDGQLGAESSAAKVSKRVERPASNTAPLGRIDMRIQNRVQNRIRNRIDRYYNPRANATSPFVVASDRVRNPGARSRR
ncbi:hypothetical protein [Sphingomonas sp.]|uniref:hypothetical protein n=1 Tax=Sphingomonas sp. TaxID=28214 RepID=UPI001EB9DB53|nr:hypothetical protein [Sphingomonas sp.]MBX3594743.1 hypothetical protein [Sphingomonas sp.]